MPIDNKIFLKLLDKLKEDGHSETNTVEMISMSAKHKNYFMSLYCECSPFDEPTDDNLYINEFYFEDKNEFRIYDLLAPQRQQIILKFQDLWTRLIKDIEEKKQSDSDMEKQLSLEAKGNWIKYVKI
tara:strand:- start:936 stop:1316 length:381 start_codon:yes stop_codon:yes gene_type:complete